MWKWCIAQYPWSCVWWPPSGTWAKRKTYPPLTTSSPLQRLIVGRKKREGEGENSSKALWKKSHGTLRSSPPLHKGWETKQEKAISHFLPLYTLHPHPSWGKLWRSQARRHLSEWQSEWGSKKNRAWEQTSCFVLLPKNTSASECFLVMSLDQYKNGNQYFITPHLSRHHSLLLQYSFPFFPLNSSSALFALRLFFFFFCTLDHSLSVSIIFSF